jgi:hypothetical protein
LAGAEVDANTILRVRTTLEHVVTAYDAQNECYPHPLHMKKETDVVQFIKSILSFVQYGITQAAAIFFLCHENRNRTER